MQFPTYHLGTLKKNGSRVYPCLIRPARYQGVYSDALWHAWPVRSVEHIPADAYGSDVRCGTWWSARQDTGIPIVGLGSGPSSAHRNLTRKMRKKGIDSSPEEYEEMQPYLSKEKTQSE